MSGSEESGAARSGAERPGGELPRPLVVPHPSAGGAGAGGGVVVAVPVASAEPQPQAASQQPQQPQQPQLPLWSVVPPGGHPYAPVVPHPSAGVHAVAGGANSQPGPAGRPPTWGPAPSVRDGGEASHAVNQNLKLTACVVFVALVAIVALGVGAFSVRQTVMPVSPATWPCWFPLRFARRESRLLRSLPGAAQSRKCGGRSAPLRVHTNWQLLSRCAHIDWQSLGSRSRVPPPPTTHHLPVP
jgi:hypothetical protein